ncbi:MAG: ATP synthase subunit C [Gammaproteobacteria bacterium]
MMTLIVLMTAALATMVLLGLWLELKPRLAPLPRWTRPAVGGQIATFVVAHVALVLMGIDQAMAATEVAAEAAGAGISIGTGLGLIGAGIPTAFSTVGAGIAVGPIGAASLAAVSEKPETFGRTLIYLGLAEGIAIYGLVMSILILDKV